MLTIRFWVRLLRYSLSHCTRHSDRRVLISNFPPTDISELERFRQSQEEEEEEDGAASVVRFPSLAHEQETASLYFTPTGTPIRDTRGIAGAAQSGSTAATPTRPVFLRHKG